MPAPIRPVGFGGHKRGALIKVVIDDKRVTVLIADRDRLRLFGSMLLALDKADLQSIGDFVALETKRRGL